jgi:GAF domain-containing protein
VVVPDIEKDEEFAPYRDVVRAAGVKSCMTTPLLSSQKVFIGNVSTHFATIHTPTAIEVDTIKSYSVAAANHLLKLLGDESLKTKAISMSRGLYEEAGATLVYTERLGGLTTRRTGNRTTCRVRRGAKRAPLPAARGLLVARQQQNQQAD